MAQPAYGNICNFAGVNFYLKWFLWKLITFYGKTCFVVRNTVIFLRVDISTCILLPFRCSLFIIFLSLPLLQTWLTAMSVSATIALPEGDRLLWHCHSSFARWYIGTIFVYYLPRLHSLNINRCNKRKCLYAKKGKKEMILQKLYRLLHTDAQVLADQQELIYISSVWTQDVIWKTCQER